MMTFDALKREIWRTTLILGLLQVIGVALLWPALALASLSGVALGSAYLWNLMREVARPRQKGQVAFSLTRMAFFAYLVGSLGHGSLAQTTVVFAGFLSYKMAMAWRCLREAVQVFRPPAAGKSF